MSTLIVRVVSFLSFLALLILISSYKSNGQHSQRKKAEDHAKFFFSTKPIPPPYLANPELVATANDLKSEMDHPYGPEPDWKMEYQPGHVYADFMQAPLGDVNGDGYDDYLWQSYDTKYTLYGNIFFGSPTGLKQQPDWFARIPGQTWLHGGLGDINGDGYDDFYTALLNGMVFIYLGSPNGPPLTPSFTFRFEFDSDNFEMDFIVKLGDVNGDGYDDFALGINYYGSWFVYYGSANNDYSTHDYIIHGDLMFFNIGTGDFNGDGFDDISLSKTPFSEVYFGGPDGLPSMPDQVFEDANISGLSGDFNGDGFDDIVNAHSTTTNNAETSSYVVYFTPGSSGGLQPDQKKVVGGKTVPRNQIVWHSSLGDINNDGFDDFKIGDDLFYGGVMYYLSKYVGFYTTYSKIQVQAVGDLNGDGSSDLVYFEQPWIYYSPSYEPVSISCQSLVREECFKGAGFYNVPKPQTAGHIQKISYYMGGITYESDNASGYFNGRTSYVIEWTALGYNYQELKCVTNLQFIHAEPTSVSIKDAYSTPVGGDPNTIYVGYGSDGFRLAAIPAGGSAPYSYLWSNGSTEKNPRIAETIPGEYPYWVKMKNVHGCESSDTVVVKVENALCSSPLVDAVMSQYPMILQNPVLANLIKSNSKIAVCKDGQTLCFTKAVVDIRITRAGYTIGACTPGVIPAEAFMTDEMENILRGELKVIVAPNPSSHSFQLSVVSIYNAPVMIRIMDLAGRQVEVMNNASANQTITVGHRLRAGTYIAEVISGKERKVVKLVKMQ